MAAAEAQHNGDGEQADDGEEPVTGTRLRDRISSPIASSTTKTAPTGWRWMRLRFERRHEEQMHHHEQGQGGQDAIAPFVMKAVEEGSQMPWQSRSVAPRSVSLPGGTRSDPLIAGPPALLVSGKRVWEVNHR